MARRASSSVMANEVGIPYQIFAEAVSAGKTIDGTKKKVSWRYGYSNSDKEHYIEFKLSLMTGKKTIFHDGREIFHGGALLEAEFDHTWQHEGHILRLDCALGVTTDHSFILQIDGTKFKDLTFRSSLPADCVAVQTFDKGVPASGVTKGFGSSSGFGGGGASRRASTGSMKPVNPTTSSTPPRPTVQTVQRAPSPAISTNNDGDQLIAFTSPTSSSANAFDSSDPFSSSGDPFASSSATKPAPKPSNTNTPSKAANAADVFGSDPFASSSDPFASTNTSASASVSQHNRAPSSNSSTGSAGSSVTHSRVVSSSAASGGIAVAAAPRAPSANLLDDDFDATPPRPPASTSTSGAAAVFDVFASTDSFGAAPTAGSAAVVDPFAPSASTNSSAGNSLNNSFSGMSMYPPAPAAKTGPAGSAAPSTPPTAAAVPAKPVDKYGGLVNLDLGGSAGGAGGQAVRRTSLTDPSKSLNGMMGRPASMNASSAAMGSGPIGGAGAGSGGSAASIMNSFSVPNDPFGSPSLAVQPPAQQVGRRPSSISYNTGAGAGAGVGSGASKRSSLDTLDWKTGK